MYVYFVYELTTGKLCGERGMPAVMAEGYPAKAGRGWIQKVEGTTLETSCVDLVSGALVLRSPLPTTYSNTSVPGDGVSEIVISGLPVGTSAVCFLPDGKVNVIVDDSTLEVSSDVPGIGEVQLSHGLHLSQTIEVTFT